MKTWRQGVLGEMILPGHKKLFVKCLKYPLALFNDKKNDFETGEREKFSAFVALSVFPFIERCGETEFTPLEKQIVKNFSMNFDTGIISILQQKIVDRHVPESVFWFPEKTVIGILEIQSLNDSFEQK